VTDSLTEYAYNAELAGLRYTIGASDRGLQIHLSGYNDKLPVLARHVVEHLRDLAIKPERMEVMKQMV
jgi:insulysin